MTTAHVVPRAIAATAPSRRDGPAVERIGPARSKLALVVGSYGVAQAAIAISALLRIPIVVRTIGLRPFGAVVILGALGPIFLVAASGIRRAITVVVAECDARMEPAAAAAALASARRRGARNAIAVVGCCAIACVTLPVSSWIGLDVGNARDGQLALVLTAGICAGAAWPAGWWGVFEARQRAALPSVVVAIAAVAGLAGTLVLAYLQTGFVPFVVLNAATSALPFFLVALIGYRVYPDLRRSGVHRQPATRQAIRRFTVFSGVETATRGLDPLVVGAVLGSAAAAQYGVALRLGLATTLVPTATAPVIAATFASRRGGAKTLRRRHLASVLAWQVGLGIAAGSLLVAFGPWAGRLLATSEGQAPRSLYVALAALAPLWGCYTALRAAAAGPSLLRAGAILSVVTGALNVGLSIVLTRSVGMTGPALASIVAVTCYVAAILALLVRSEHLLRETHFVHSSVPGSRE